MKLERYHAFLIFTASRFTKNDLDLARKISKSFDKKFFFIRTKIDIDVKNEKRKSPFNEDEVLKKIRRECSNNLRKALTSEQDQQDQQDEQDEQDQQDQQDQQDKLHVFLISNHKPDKWDFARLTQAILDTLMTYQRDTLVLSLGKVLTRSSPDLFQRKVKVLRGRIWKVASASAAAALVPLPGLSFGVDAWLILNELSFYRSQFAIPEEGSDEYKRLPFSTQEKVSKVSLTTIPQLVACLTAFTTEAAVEDYTRFVPILGSVIASSMSFTTTYLALKKLLKHVEEVAKIVMREAIKKAMAEIEAEID